MRVEVIGSEGMQMVEPIEKVGVYICGMPIESYPATEEDLEDARKAVFAFEHNKNMLMGNFEVLKYGKITVMREVKIIPERKGPGKVVDLSFPPSFDIEEEEEQEEETEFYEIRPRMSLKVSVDEVDNIVGKALDGGISYWCENVEIKDNDFRGCAFVSQTVSRGATLMLHCGECDEVWELTREAVLYGLKYFLDSDICRGIEIVGGEVKTGGIGIYDADKIVQLGLFGDIVYYLEFNAPIDGLDGLEGGGNTVGK